MLAMSTSVQDFEYLRMASILQQIQGLGPSDTHSSLGAGAGDGLGMGVESHEMMMFYPGGSYEYLTRAHPTI